MVMKTAAEESGMELGPEVRADNFGMDRKWSRRCDLAFVVLYFLDYLKEFFDHSF